MGLIGKIFGGIGDIVGGVVTGNPIGGITSAVGEFTGGSPGSGSPFPPPPVPDTTTTTSTSRVFGFPVSSHQTQIVSSGGPPPATNRVASSGGQMAVMTGTPGTIIGYRPKSWAVRVRSEHGQKVSKALHRCGPGYVLAKDGNCYPKGMLPRKWRKWPARRKGPISYRDWKALQRAASARNRAYKVAKKAGLSVRKGK